MRIAGLTTKNKCQKDDTADLYKKLRRENPILPMLDALTDIVIFLNSLNRLTFKKRKMIIAIRVSGEIAQIYFNETLVAETQSSGRRVLLSPDNPGYDRFKEGIMDAMEKKEDLVIQSPNPL